jgi:hypothetical protein
MNILNILDQIDKVDTDVNNRLNPRREAMKHMFKFGKKVAVASVPLGLGAVFSTASAQTPASDAVVTSLQFILALKHFEYALLSGGLAKVTFNAPNAATDVVALKQIQDQESKHIAFLQTAITAAGKTPVAAQTNYDFTAGGNYNDIFFSNKTFIKEVQVIKDAVIRATKGQLPSLVKQGDLLAAAMAIHAVDARHSARLRMMRLADGYSPTNKPWLSEVVETAGVPVSQDIFVGEDNVNQGTTSPDVTNINGQSVTHAQATEAFDEPLTMAQVATALAPFKVTI